MCLSSREYTTIVRFWTLAVSVFVATLPVFAQSPLGEAGIQAEPPTDFQEIPTGEPLYPQTNHFIQLCLASAAVPDDLTDALAAHPFPPITTAELHLAAKGALVELRTTVSANERSMISYRLTLARQVCGASLLTPSPESSTAPINFN
jgi:hypothetical protein